jgi:hypothetical protein
VSTDEAVGRTLAQCRELAPYPWAAVPCPWCGELELAQTVMGVGLVCMACAGVAELDGSRRECQTTTEAGRPTDNVKRLDDEP